MLKWLRRGLFSVLVLLVLLLLAVQFLRWTAYGEEERAAVALAGVPPPPATGRSGFAALALSDFEVPKDAMDAEMAAEVRNYSRWLADQGDSVIDGEIETWVPSVAARYPVRAPLTYSSSLCTLGGANCLALVKADTGAMRELVAGQSERLALVDQALAADHLRNPYPPSHHAPFPPYSALRLSLTQAAFDAVDGRVPEALARTCRTLAGARRFNADAHDLVGKMVFPALAEGSVALLLDLRREYPGVPLPAGCAPALVPVQPSEVLICDAMRGEFRQGAALTAMQEKAPADRWSPAALFSRWVLMDGRLQDAWMAHTLAAPCTDDYRHAVLAGSVPVSPEKPVSRDDVRCYAALISCVLAEIALPAYGDYQGRLLDHAARLRLVLAAHSAVGTDVRPAELHSAAASPGYAIAVDPEARTLSVRSRFARAAGTSDFKVAF
ncbi:MAG: hypothetical protein DCF27_04650 [Lysobacteraceae bacterium]|nr:MAG: hypothetical protein DCF27_04650 [Xanthomonadaceae bacterium]